MATFRAIANGNWSSTSTWNGGVVPTNGATVYANGFNVTIDQDITIGGSNNVSVNAGSFVIGQWYEITFVGTTNFTTIGASSNTIGTIFLASGVGTGTGTAITHATITTLNNTGAGATAGGGFILSTSRVITTDMRGSTTNCLTASGAINISLSGLQLIAGTTQTSYVLVWGSTGTLTLTGCVVQGSNGGPCLINSSTGTISANSCTINGGYSTNVSYAIFSNTTGSILVSGSVISGGTTNQSGTAIYVTGLGLVSITTSTINGGYSSGTSSYGVGNMGNGTLTITNSTLIGIAGPAVANQASGVTTCTGCTFTAGNNHAVLSTVTGVTISGSLFDGPTGVVAVHSQRQYLSVVPALMQHRRALNGSSTFYTLYGPDFGVFGNPASTDVRTGVSYAAGNLTGTLAVPAAGSVALGVPVDATTGTAVLTAANVQEALTSQGLTTTRAANLDNLDATISSRLGSSAYTAPANSDISAIKANTDANLDAAISSRLATSGYTAPDNTSITAIKAKTDNLPSSPAAVSDIPTAATNASAVRTNLTTELGRIDVATSSRLATSGYTAPANSDIAAIKANTDANLDATVSSRLAASAYTAPDNADITAIKAKTDANLDAAVSSRLAASAYTAPDNVDIAAIKAKTDNLPAAPAATGDIPSASTIASAVRTNLAVELAHLDANISSAGDPSATATAVWSEATSSLSVSGSIGERLKNSSTVATTGEQLTTVLT
jgi:hypothetical protein